MLQEFTGGGGGQAVDEKIDGDVGDNVARAIAEAVRGAKADAITAKAHFKANILAELEERPISIAALLRRHDSVQKILRAEGERAPDMLTDELIQVVFSRSLQMVHARDRREIYFYNKDKQPHEEAKVWKPPVLADVFKDHDDAVALLRANGRQIDRLLSLHDLTRHALIQRGSEFHSAMDRMFARIDADQGDVREKYAALKAIALWHVHGDRHTAEAASKAAERMKTVGERIPMDADGRKAHQAFVDQTAQRIASTARGGECPEDRVMQMPEYSTRLVGMYPKPYALT